MLAITPAIHAQPSPPDSGQCPWKFPIHLNVQALGKTSEVLYAYDPSNGYYDKVVDGNVTGGSVWINTWIDTSACGSLYSLIRDTLNYTLSYQCSTFEEHLTIVFAHGHDSIILFKYQLNASGSDYARESRSHSQEFELAGLLYDDTSIICPDSSITLHSASVGESYTTTEDLLDENESNFIDMTSMNLSGIFRPTHLSYFASVSNPEVASGMSIRSYPNPFSQSATISFTPEASGYAEVSVMNLLGVEIARLFSGELDAGEHSFVWSNSASLPDGIYECVIRMNGQVEKLPMMLLR